MKGIGIIPWIRKLRKKPEVSDCEDLNHEVRNALLGIQLERRRLWKAVEACDGRIKAHIARIEAALRAQRVGES